MANPEPLYTVLDELRAAASERGFSEGVNAAFDVVQRHVSVEVAVAIGRDLVILINGPDEFPGEITDPAATSGPRGA